MSPIRIILHIIRQIIWIEEAGSICQVKYPFGNGSCKPVIVSHHWNQYTLLFISIHGKRIIVAIIVSFTDQTGTIVISPFPHNGTPSAKGSTVKPPVYLLFYIVLCAKLRI